MNAFFLLGLTRRPNFLNKFAIRRRVCSRKTRAMTKDHPYSENEITERATSASFGGVKTHMEIRKVRAMAVMATHMMTVKPTWRACAWKAGPWRATNLCSKTPQTRPCCNTSTGNNRCRVCKPLLTPLCCVGKLVLILLTSRLAKDRPGGWFRSGRSSWQWARRPPWALRASSQASPLAYDLSAASVVALVLVHFEVDHVVQQKEHDWK